jgi:single-strand DNA-binding protein
MSQITIVGNLTRDPDLRFTDGGTPVVSVSIAVNKRYMKDGEWVDGTPEFHDCVAWQEQATNIAATLSKGMRVVAVGDYQQRPYEVDGQKRRAHEVRITEIGPGLRWATAVVTKKETASGRAPFEPNDYFPNDEGTSAAAPANGQLVPAGAPAGANEEPF